MRVPFVDLRAQYRAIQPEIDAAIRAVIDDAAFVGGSHVKRFEEMFASWLDVRECVGCANGTDAIEIVLRAWGIGPDDEVIVPALTWISTSEAVNNVGARPVFADIVPGAYTIDPRSIRARLTGRTRAIIPVHLYGLAAQMAEILDIARERGLKVLEDAAQAHGALYRGQPVGTLGDAATFSFYPGKNLGAYGDAGAITTRDTELARAARMLGNHGQLKKHEHDVVGRNSRLDGLQAAILAAKLPHLKDWNQARRGHAERYDARLRDAGIPIGKRPTDCMHIFHVYAVEIPERTRVQALLREDGVETAIHYPRALSDLPLYAERGQDKKCPAAGAAAARVLSLPMYPELTDEAIDFVCKRLEHALRAVQSA